MPSNAAAITPSRTAQIQPGRLSDLTAHGQSCWLDDLSRAMIANGELARMVGQGVRGATANPATFGKAITQGPEYCEEIAQLGSKGRKRSEVYERLAFADVRAGCDIFGSVYEQVMGALSRLGIDFDSRSSARKTRAFRSSSGHIRH